MIDGLIKKILGVWTPVAIAVAVVAGVASQFFLGNDNVLEEIAETVVEQLLGNPDLDLDFSPPTDEVVKEKIKEQLTKKVISEFPDKATEIILEKVHDKVAAALDPDK